MTKDKALEELFLAQKPHFDDHDAFMATVTKRLDAVAAFVVGIISGAVTMAFILTTPADVPLFAFQVQIGFLLWLAEYSRPIAATALALVMSFGMMSIINNVQDIVRMRRKNAFIPKFSL